MHRKWSNILMENQVHEGIDKGSDGKSPKREFDEHGTWGRKSLSSLYVKEFDRVLHGACSACRTQGLFYPDDVTLISLGASYRWDPDSFCFSFGKDGNPWQRHIRFGDMLARLSHNPIRPWLVILGPGPSLFSLILFTTFRLSRHVLTFGPGNLCDLWIF